MSIDVHPNSHESVQTPGYQTPQAAAGSMNQAAARPQLLTQSRWLKRAIFVIGALAIGGVAWAIFWGGMSSSDETQLTHTIARGDLTVSITEQGTLESSDNTEIKCRVRGYSTVIWVIETGQEVKPGDELVRLDTKAIEDAISDAATNEHESRATLAETEANVAQAEIAIEAYLEGTYRTQMQNLERQHSVAESNLMTAQKMLELSELMFRRGYISELEVAGNEFTVTQAELELEVIKTQMRVLEEYTQAMELERLNGNLTAARSKLEADIAGLTMDSGRHQRALEELEHCVIRADREGLVIYPSAAAWKNAPDVAEGATVRKDQVLLLMPDLTKMQVKVGIHESMIDRVVPGQRAMIALPEQVLEGKVLSVASVTRPAGWWTGNVVKYDTIIELPSVEGLKPGMSAEVELILSEHKDVLQIPVAAVVETEDGYYCWVNTAQGMQKRPIQLGDSNDVFIVVNSGLKEGDEVVLNPLAHIDEAQAEALRPMQNRKPARDEYESEPERTQSSEVQNVN